MVITRSPYRGYEIDVYATKSVFDGLWIGHYEIKKSQHGPASASLSGPTKTAQDAIDNALRVAKEFIDGIIDSK